QRRVGRIRRRAADDQLAIAVVERGRAQADGVVARRVDHAALKDRLDYRSALEVGWARALGGVGIAVALHRQPRDRIGLDALELADERILADRWHAGAGVGREDARAARTIDVLRAGETLVAAGRTNPTAVGSANAPRAREVVVPKTREGAERHRLVRGQDDIEVDLDPSRHARAREAAHRI